MKPENKQKINSEADEEFSFRIHLLWDAMDKHLLKKIPSDFIYKLDIDELGSVLLGLLSLEKNDKKRK